MRGKARGELFFDAESLKKITGIAESGQQLSAIPFLGIADTEGRIKAVVAELPANQVFARGTEGYLSLSRDDRELVDGLAVAAAGIPGRPTVAGLIRPQGQVNVWAGLKQGPVSENDVFNLTGGERELLDALSQKLGGATVMEAIVSDTGDETKIKIRSRMQRVSSRLGIPEPREPEITVGLGKRR